MSYIADDLDYLDLWEDFYKSINQKFKKVIEESDRSRKENADLLEITQRQLIHLINGRCNSVIKTRTIKLLVDNYGVSLDWLFDVHHTLPKYTQEAKHEAVNSDSFGGILNWNEYYKSVNDKFLLIFADAHQSKQNFIDDIGMHNQYFNKILKRKKSNTPWTIKRLKRLADDYAVSLDWLFDVGYKRKRYRR